MAAVVKRLPVGTNLGLVRLMWALLRGSFLASRGGIFPALLYSGFSREEVRASWGAFRYGSWSITRLLSAWRSHVEGEGQWQARVYEGYRAVAVDITGFFRPRLRGWLTKVYHGVSGKALRGVGYGLVVDVGSVAGERFALPRSIIRSKNAVSSDTSLKGATLTWLAKYLKDDEVALLDAGFKLAELQAAGVKHFVLRQASNCTARRNALPEYKGRGAKPRYGELIRPLARTHTETTLSASPADEISSFVLEGRKIEVHLWHGLVRSDQKVSSQHETFSLLVFFDPLYKHPLVLALSLALKPKSVFLLYRDRWSVEQLPLAAKQMLGAGRSFVFTPESVYRLPELALLTGNILTYLAAMLPPIPTGFWDTHPKKRPVACASL